MPRTERWTNTEDDGHSRTAYIEVQDNRTVIVAYELLASLISQVGFTKESDDGS